MPTRLRALVCAVASALLLVGCGQEAAGPGVTRGPESPAQYVALGDSYTSLPEVPRVVDEGCLRSDRNYPTLVADRLNLSLDDVSCGGAATTALVGVQETSTGVRPPQFDALTADTEVVTLSLGGNDEMLFYELLVTCLELSEKGSATGTPCRDHMTQGGDDTALEVIDLIQDRLTSALAGVKARAPHAAVVLIGYPQLVPERVRCESLPLSSGDYAYMHELLEELGRATRQAAKTAVVRYVDLLAASEGHDVCAGDEAWIQGNVTDPDRPAATMHPFEEEQQAVADLVIAALTG